MRQRLYRRPVDMFEFQCSIMFLYTASLTVVVVIFWFLGEGYLLDNWVKWVHNPIDVGEVCKAKICDAESPQKFQSWRLSEKREKTERRILSLVPSSINKRTFFLSPLLASFELYSFS